MIWVSKIDIQVPGEYQQREHIILRATGRPLWKRLRRFLCLAHTVIRDLGDYHSADEG